jgi:hypothetical protein
MQWIINGIPIQDVGKFFSRKRYYEIAAKKRPAGMPPVC